MLVRSHLLPNELGREHKQPSRRYGINVYVVLPFLLRASEGFEGIYSNAFASEVGTGKGVVGRNSYEKRVIMLYGSLEL